MTSQVLTNAKGDKEMLFSPDLPDEHFNRYSAVDQVAVAMSTVSGSLFEVFQICT